MVPGLDGNQLVEDGPLRRGGDPVQRPLEGEIEQLVQASGREQPNATFMGAVKFNAAVTADLLAGAAREHAASIRDRRRDRERERLARIHGFACATPQ